MTHPKIPLAQTIIQLCKAKQIRHIIISPGSRNAPLTIGFTHDDFFTCYSIVDERCAAFFALGIAQRLNEPVAAVCTSGSALLNYYPAVSEAFYSDIPLVILSADRPKHLVGIGDGQTINQEHVFANHILYSANLKEDIKEEESFTRNEELPIFKNLENKLEKFLGLQQSIQEKNETEINTALNTALHQNGPVHINMPFDEPLYDVIDAPTADPTSIEIKDPIYQFPREELNECIEIWNKAKKKLILIGVNQPNSIENQWLEELTKDDSVIVFTETTSNLNNDDFFPSIDKIIAPLNDHEFAQLQPDILVSFGGLIVSKKIKTFLRKYQPTQHWHVDVKKANDTFFCLNKHIRLEPNIFLGEILSQIKLIPSDYKSYWNLIKKRREIKHQEYLEHIAFSDFKVFDSLLKSIPSDSVLHLGNSSTIRYAQLFNLNKTLTVYCNRGTSGIDGSTSTALGCAVVTNKQTTLITGDLSFFYDSNALWNNYIPNNFRIVIINNQGGGIFRILPGHKNTDNFDTYFETKHNKNAEYLAKMYQFNYYRASNEKELETVLDDFFELENQPKILEIFTPRELNDEVLLNYFKHIK